MGPMEQPWEDIAGTERPRTIAAELGKEIRRGHALHGRALAVRLACNACDDVLLRLDEGPDEGQYAVVHPTWSGRRERPPWPATKIYPDADQARYYLERCFT